ncbi:MAG: RNA polymerase sigma factor [Sedimentisphaerales bacterium]|nr:RNA polymerase sigma factor [Sedimentisphaerales bacterium]MBN2843455.1 RNA polymerase sigma factor [Sedimentisphaerales bacterium]
MNKALSIELMLTLPETAEVAADQRWVLTAMAKHGQILVQVLWRVLGNESDVCDAYQETFLKLAGINSVPEKAKVRAYLLRTGTNAAIDILRKRRNSKKLSDELQRFKPESYTVQDSDLDMQYLLDQLRQSLVMLPDSLQQVVMLRDLGEMTYSQVAEVLGITVESARVYRRRAIIMLAEIMED